MMVLVTGGSASGKSAWAEKRLEDFGKKKRIYLATMIPWDAECRERINRHRIMRDGKGFETLECPVDVGEAKIAPGSAVLLECLSNLTANELYREDRGERTDSPEERILEAVLKLREKAEDLVVVTGEVFSDGQDYGEETETYRRILGSLNQRLAAEADEAVEVVCGTAQYGKGEGAARKMKKQEAEAKSRPEAWEKQKAEPVKQEENKKEDTDMKLVVGGAYQGKLKFAFRLAENRESNADGPEKNVSCGAPFREDEDVDRAAADGSRDGAEAAFQKRILYNFQDYVRRFFLNEPEPERKLAEFLDRLERENPEVIIVADEVGCGIVPVEREERLWRELCGDACQMIAGRAKEVYRVVCGLPTLLKGGRP